MIKQQLLVDGWIGDIQGREYRLHILNDIFNVLEVLYGFKELGLKDSVEMLLMLVEGDNRMKFPHLIDANDKDCDNKDENDE